MAEWPGHLRLFPSVFAVVVVAIVVGVGAYWGFSELLLGVSPLAHLTDATIHPQDVLKLALTVAAGLGGVVALTVAYRRQRATESGQFGQRFADSAAQLGGASAAVRMAGAYAMATLADETDENLRRQQCVDVLCAYLRLPYHSGERSDLLEQVVTTDQTVASDGHSHNDQRTYRLQPQEREVRLTIIRIIRDHLRVLATINWGGHNFDFSGTVFDGGSFTGAVFSGGTVDFTGAVFSGGAVDFTDATFSGAEVNFREAVFSGGEVSFWGAKFSDSEVNLGGAVFSGGAVDFGGAGFWGGAVDFWGAKFSGADVSFRGAMFRGGEVNFREAVFSGGQVGFWGATFSGGAVSFRRAVFSGGKVSFWGSKFSGGAVSFWGAAFLAGEVGFRETVFSGGEVSFRDANFFGGSVDLRRVSNWSCAPTGLPDAAEGLGLPVVWTARWSELPNLVARL